MPTQLSSELAHTEHDRYQQVRRVLGHVLWLNLLVAIAKVIVGVTTGALSMVADGFHSALDASSNIIGIVGTALAERPPDESHPYGHRRFETMATLTIGIGLLLVAWEILKAAVERLSGSVAPEVTPLSFAVMFVTIIINLIVVLYESTNGKRLHSELLLADAAQTRIDVLVSLSVIVSLAASALGFYWVDTVMALIIVVLIGRAAFGILWQTTQILVDAAAVDPAEISLVVKAVPGVDSILRVRSRGPSDMILTDIDVQIQPAMTAEHASTIANEIEDRVKAAFSGVSEVQVHFAPHRDSPKDYILETRAAADALGLSVHEITQIITGEGLILEMHVEVPPTLTLAAAHKLVSELEKRVQNALPEVNGVLTHIEPANSQPGAVMHTTKATLQREQALSIAQRLYPDAHWHDATIRLAMGGYALTIHCWLPGGLSVQEAHEIAEQVETQIRAALPQVQRVTIHTEPPEDEGKTPVSDDIVLSE